MTAAEILERAERRAMLTSLARRFWPLAIIVLLLLVEHFRDRARDAELERLRTQVAADSALRVAAVARTDTAIAKVDTATWAFARADTGYRRVASSTRSRVDTIIASLAPDTVKIRELVQVIDTIRVAGDSVVARCTELANTCQQLRLQVGVERTAWSTERRDLAQALAVSESRHRHLGLGMTAGYGALRTPDGTIRAGPSIAIGVTYRW